MKKTLKIEGMSCGHCVAAVTKALNAVNGISGVTVDLASKTASATVSDSVKDDSLRAAVEDAGFDVTGIE